MAICEGAVCVVADLWLARLIWSTSDDARPHPLRAEVYISYLPSASSVSHEGQRTPSTSRSGSLGGSSRPPEPTLRPNRRLVCDKRLKLPVLRQL
jgi:hypothetical protein